MAVKEMKENLKHNRSIYTGRLSDSIQAERLRPMLWGVGSQAKYQWYLEYGTRPHKPPLKPILEWARLKHKMYGEKGKQAAYPLAKAIQKTIEAKGTEPHPFIRPAHEAVQKAFPKIVEKYVRKIKHNIGR